MQFLHSALYKCHATIGRAAGTTLAFEPSKRSKETGSQEDAYGKELLWHKSRRVRLEIDKIVGLASQTPELITEIRFLGDREIQA